MGKKFGKRPGCRAKVAGRFPFGQDALLPDLDPRAERMYEQGLLLDRLRRGVRRKYPLPEHLLRTEWWVEQLRPGADEALRAAALLHDIDRFYPLGPDEEVPEQYDFTDRESLLWHGERSSRYAERVLRKLGVEDALVERVKYLVAHHETGGDDGADALMEADSLSFLENNVGFFLRKVTAERAIVRRKIDYMFRRIRSEAARELALPMYRRVLKKLGRLTPGSIEPDGCLDLTGLPRSRTR